MDLVLRAIVVFFFVLILTRVIGRRELSQLAPFDLILLIILGDALQQGLTQDDYSVTGAILIVEDGKAIEKNLRRERLTLEEVMESARMHEIGSLDEVRWAVVERNGEISFLKKSN